jgi:tetratricopeptide (TPR) repeat protein
MRPSIALAAFAIWASCLAATSGCRQQDEHQLNLRPVSLPDLSRMEAPVRVQIQAQFSALNEKRGNRATPTAEVGNAFGEMGRLFLATESLDAAEPCLLNATLLVPNDARWPYYLGHLYRMNSDLPEAAEFFEKAVQMQPGNEAALIWLGNVLLDLSKPHQAQQAFTKALAVHPDGASALFGLGRAALELQDYLGAVKYLEAALVQDPAGSSIHYPLAMAYRALHQPDKAEEHLRQRGDHQVAMADPLMGELGSLLQSTLAYELRGDRALDSGRWPDAVAAFQKAAELTPNNPAVHQKLGSALYLTGDADGAREQFEEAVRLSPQYAKAHYSLGVLLASSGHNGEAIERFSLAVKFDPNYAEANLALADTERRSGRVEQSLLAYSRVLAIDPRVTSARIGYALALVKLKRYRDARDWLEASVRSQPNQVELAHTLARVLAAVPDNSVRDGHRAVALMQEVLKTQQTIDAGETMAMALAETGQYGEAVSWQHEAIDAATQGGRQDLLKGLNENLLRYERREPCRTPWRDDDSVYAPGSRRDPEPHR